MPQTKQTGAAGAARGRRVAEALARHFGVDIEARRNVCNLNGLRTSLKFAGPATTSIGVTYPALQEVDRVIAAFQQKDGSFALWSLPVAVFRQMMTPSRSSPRAAETTGIVTKRVFEQQGESLGVIALPDLQR